MGKPREGGASPTPALPAEALVLDGPMGTALEALGVHLPVGSWSAHALEAAPGLVGRVHRESARAGADVLRTNTFRTQRRHLGPRWERLARAAVRLAARERRPGQRLAGSIGPLEDCYRPDRSPRNAGREHAALARVLRDEGCELLVCETFPHVGEALEALEACLATGLPTWVAFTLGPFDPPLLDPAQLRAGAKAAAERGAAAVLLSCSPPRAVGRCLPVLREAGVPFGAYANAGRPSEGFGWARAGTERGSAARYAALARSWLSAGASVVGACCGGSAAHVRALVRAQKSLPIPGHRAC